MCITEHLSTFKLICHLLAHSTSLLISSCSSIMSSGFLALWQSLALWFLALWRHCTIFTVSCGQYGRSVQFHAGRTVGLYNPTHAVRPVSIQSHPLSTAGLNSLMHAVRSVCSLMQAVRPEIMQYTNWALIDRIMKYVVPDI